MAVDKCYLVPEMMNDLLAELRAFIEGNDWRAVTEVEVRESRARARSLVIVHAASAARLEEMANKLRGLHERFPLSGIVALIDDGKTAHEEILGGVARLDEVIHGLTYRIGARSFFQVNIGILDAVFDDMAAAVKDLAGESIADLYCGLGTFGISLAGQAREVFGVESDPANVVYLKKNLALNKTGNFTVCEGSTEEWLGWILEKNVAAVILDPPRRGVDPGMLRELAAKPVRRLLYLSCNPTTLARDLKILRPGYSIDSVRIYDFFPHSPHIETFAVLSRQRGV